MESHFKNMLNELQLQEIKNNVDEVLYNYQEININTAQDYTQAGDTLKLINNRIKIIEAKRVEYTNPLLEAKRKIDEDMKSLIAPLEKVIEEIKSKMLLWKREEQKKLDEEQKRIENEAIKKAVESNSQEAQIQVTVS